MTREELEKELNLNEDQKARLHQVTKHISEAGSAIMRIEIMLGIVKLMDFLPSLGSREVALKILRLTTDIISVVEEPEVKP